MDAAPSVVRAWRARAAWRRGEMRHRPLLERRRTVELLVVALAVFAGGVIVAFVIG
jgi:hypothetical protein